MLHDQTLDLFKVIVLDDSQERAASLEYGDIMHGYLTNFVPNAGQKRTLTKAFKPLPITTLFSVEERATLNPQALIAKQLLHYLEVYGLDSPGLFNLEVTAGKAVVIANVQGVTKAEIGEMVRTLLYANAPIRKLEDLIEIVRVYDVAYDLTKVANNEARIRLYREGDTFVSGDDAVRYIVYKTTADSMLIKSKKVIAAVKANASHISIAFLETHVYVLAQVWNRHKRIIMSLKTRKTANVINRISRFSKGMHVPIVMAINKNFIAKSLRGEITGDAVVKVLRDNITLRDKFKYLNLIEWRLLGRSDDVFVIRNGHAHLENHRPVWNAAHLGLLRDTVLASIEEDLAHLQGKKILLDPNVNYGLPTTQKQMLGNLPFGTEVSVGGAVIASGVYWEDRWGAYDLDLSTVDSDGRRTGWGDYSGYSGTNPITFSGDITSAPNGAMEFMVSQKTYDKPYGLFINIYSGEEGAEAELIVGDQVGKHPGGKTRHGNDQQWVNSPVLREKFSILSKGCIIGFVRNGKFVVYALRTSNARISGGQITKRLIAKALAPAWTVQRLFDTLGIKYDGKPSGRMSYDYDLTYGGFSVDKLENMLFNR